MAISYQDAGVNKAEGYRTVAKIRDKVRATFRPEVLGDIGGFGALFKLKKYKNPILVSGTDGVGTKLKIAFALKKYDTIGVDCVAMCVNDILCSGAEPLFFLDYLACGKLDADVSAQIIGGVATGCKQAGAALIGGETAEMPDFYTQGEYDIAGFAVGVVEEKKLIHGSAVRAGDVLIALASSGAHSNGFSLIRRVFTDFSEPFESKHKTIGEHLLSPTRIYVSSIQKLMQDIRVRAMAHITGGGLIENVPRVLPEGLCAYIDTSKVKIVPIFRHPNFAQVQREEMWNTFNMGVGFVVIVREKDVQQSLDILYAAGEDAYVIGRIKKGKDKIVLR